MSNAHHFFQLAHRLTFSPAAVDPADMTELDLEALDDDAPDVLAVEDTEPVVLEPAEDDDENERASGSHLDEGCGCVDEDDPEVTVDPDDADHEGGV